MEIDIMTVKEFLFDLPLYQRIPKEDSKDIIHFLTDRWRGKKVDGYNPIAQCDSTFELFCGIYHTIQWQESKYSLDVKYFPDRNKWFDTLEIILKCKRYGTSLHYLVHVEWEDDNHDNIKYISKVGQYPSVADFHIGQVHKYDKVLPKNKMREFTKAIGLAANGVGIGSFVYLRRIFEYLVSEALETAKKKNEKFDVEAFNTGRMSEKIQMLSGYLPDFLVENHTIYGVLSKGIHELSEEVCNKYFSILKESIEMILDEKLEAHKKELKKDSIKKTLAQIVGEIKK